MRFTCNGVSNDDEVVGEVSFVMPDSPVFGNCQDIDLAKLLRHELSSGSVLSLVLLLGLNTKNCLLPSTQLSLSVILIYIFKTIYIYIVYSIVEYIIITLDDTLNFARSPRRCSWA